ncbi:MARTX multifunctional-autoprocessing repeats-in-toxin holotoxin RtxA [Xenorhabdus ehlersii]|uniref:RTX cytotoxin n=1 Tax=Xenorhabdus ehlersii TaxID=290111 RepID=A0A2D0IYH1_9GAMM|nr:MARTX multifunctional-autoprocessing repeats-in-toxin holotoxin RtxA [Xenorhabdus ehlersii]PHM25228.1 RTX cytotoxin [Xenorhabdus ehlersii]PHM26805.1 RTX cytotoxin [Xenorhabdus ehlersii]
MGKSSSRSAEYFFTERYEDDDDGNTIHAFGVGINGVINAYGGNDNIVVGSINVTVNTTWGDDTISGATGYLKVNDTTGNLTVKGGSGFTSINKTQSGLIRFEGAAGGVKINHTGDKSGISYSGAAGYNSITRKGLQGDISFKGAGAYNEFWHETNQGNFYFAGAGGANKIDRTWFNRYQGSRGDLTFKGAGAANIISSGVENGNIDFEGAGAANNIVRKGKIGDITLRGAGASNRVERIRQVDDVYSETQGDIRFEGGGGYNSLYSDVAHGNIYFTGVGAYNEITRKGTANDFNSEGIEYAKAEEVVLTTATMSGSWIGNSHQVAGFKSTRELNTYLFAFEDGTYTKINKVQLRNDPETGKLRYVSTAWYKEGKHLKGLEKQDISRRGGFNSVGEDGAYTLSNLTVEQRKQVTVYAVEKKLTENQWVNYGNGVQIDAADITLSDAKMGGYAIYRDGTTVDVKAVKSNRMPNTYIYGKQLGKHTKVVVVELRNDPKTGMLQYLARPLYKEGYHTANLANENISPANGYQYMGTGSYSLSDLHYSVNAVRTNSSRVPDMHEYSDLELFKSATGNGDSSGDIHYAGAGGGNIIKSNVTRGNVSFKGAGIANVIEHSSEFGNTEFDGGGGANVIIKKGKEGNLNFNGAGIANVLLHQSQHGDMNVNAGGAANVLVRVGDGRYLAHLLAVGNISIHKGNGNSRISMGGGFNTHTQIGHGNAFWTGVGGANVLTQMGNGDVSSILVGGANVLTKVGKGDLQSAMFGGANIITHIDNHDASYSGSSNTSAIALGGANILTKKGKGDVQALMGGGGNVLTHIGDGKTTGIMLGGANILTKVGNGDTTGIMLGLGNVLTHVGDGQTLGIMGAVGNIFTKVGDGTTIAAMIGAGNIFTHVGEGNAWALMGGKGNIFTKVGNGDALALMLALGNVYTHIGDGMSVALMIAKGNIATKVGNGDALSAMIGKGNVFTQIGDGSTFAAMIGGANVLTKVGDDLTAALMVGEANIYTHVGNGTSIGLFAGKANIMTKVGDGTTLSAMFGEANIMTHVGDGLTGVLALGKANIVTKVGNDFMGVVAASEANVVTHVNNEGNSTTAALLAGKGNILTKVGDGTAVGLLISKVGNIMTHVGDGTTVGFAKGEGNIITKVGDGLGINAAWGKANILTHVGDGDRYNLAKGDANIITKVGDGQEVSVVQGQANILTHVGNGDDYTGAWGKANVMTKVGDGRNVVLTKGEANIVTQIGDGDSFNALWSQGNVVTKVGDGIQVTAAKGKGNITTTVGNGLSVTAAHGDLNINTKVGDGVSVNVAWGKFNVNTRVGDGLNVSVMKGKGNANIRVGDGLNINASYARNNVAIQVGNGDFYSLAVAESNTQSNKLDALFDNIKQTVLGSAGSQGINYLVNGDEANTSGTHKGRGAIELPEVSSLNGFKLTEMDEITSDLKDSLKGSVTGVDTPDMGSIEKTLGNEKHLNPKNQSRNLIVNGDFEQGAKGWTYTNGIEASHSAKSYGLSAEGHGDRVSELDVKGNTHICQNIQNLTEGEEITVKFDFARRVGSSADNGLEVWWNGEFVFAAANGKSEWQNKTLTLTAKAGKNLLGFSGIGLGDGLGYVLDNVSATSSSYLSDRAITDHMQQDKAAHNALQDKEKAEAGRQRLVQEKDKQLAAIAGTQAQLEATDLDILNANGQTQRDAIKGEAQAVTDELMAKVKGLEALETHAAYHGESGQQWRDQFAVGLRQRIQSELNNASEIAQNQLDNSQKAAAEHLDNIKDAVAKSEAGVLKADQNHQHAEQDVEEALIQARNREKEALDRELRARQAEHDGNVAAQQAEQHGQNEVSVADSKTVQVQNDAKGSKLDGSYQPTRTGAKGSGLSGKAYESHYYDDVEKAEKSKSNINSEFTVQADGRFSKELQDLDNDLSELNDAKEALNRLQINAGIRAKKESGASALTSLHTETSVDQPVNQSMDTVTEWVRNTPRISGLDLSGLQALGETLAQPESIDTSKVSATAIKAQKVADVYRWLDSDNGAATDSYIPVPGFNRVDADIPADLRQKMVTFVEGYLNATENSVPKDQVISLAKLFVDATIDYDWDKRVEFVSRLESYGYSFEPVHGDKSIVSFWSGRNFKQYREVLDAVQTDGKKVVYDIDVKGNSFAIDLNKTLMRWGGIFLDSDIAEQKALQSTINASAYSNTGFWSSLYATGSRDDVYVIAEGGLRLGNYFWNVELPVLRQLQREGLVGEIRLLDKTAKAYQGMSPESIGRRLTEAGVSVKARFDSLSFAEQEKLLALNPDKYKPDTLVDLDIKTSAIDNLLSQALPFYGLRTERNLLVRASDTKGFEIRPWPGNNNDSFKTIMMENPEDSAQIKSIERFILANYNNYDQLPDELHLVKDRIVSHDHGRTRIIAEKIDGSWSYKPKTDLMSVGELREAAYVKGKILGDSYRHVLDALSNYQNTLQNSKDNDFEAVEKLTDLLHQVESYLKGHPDSKRVPALQNLLSQVSVRLEESLVLTEFTVRSGEKVAINNDGTPPRDREPFNPVTRFLNDELYGSREDRRNIDNHTQIILDAAVAKGAADKITLQGEAGRLTGYYHSGAQKDQGEHSPAKKVVLFIHGSGSSAEEQASIIQNHYQKQGVDMLAVNMRGYGSSDGHPSEKGLYQDARTMLSYLVNDRGIKPENIIIHGYSMGGAVAADLARYAERNGQPVSGLLLDRPMPSMTKAITAHEVPNPAGITAGLAKFVNGQFSLEKNLQGISKQTPIMLLTDNEGLGKEGEKLRAKLVVAGYQVSGEQTFYGHEDSGLIRQYADLIVSTLSEPKRESGSVKAGLLEKMVYTLFDVKSGGKELDKYSFHFTQGESLLNNLEKLVPEIGNVLLTNGNHVESKEFLEGICFALSGRYLIEERVHGVGGGKAYLSWLTDAVKAYNDNSVNKKSDINSIEASLLNQYRRQNIGPAIQDLLSMQYSQTQNMSNLVNRRKANQAYGGKLKANGLTGDRIDRSMSNDVAGYESVMEQLRNVDKTTYMSFMSEDHAMAVVVHKGENQTVWSFYDPNFGIKSFDNYSDFEHFMDSFHKGILTGYQSKLGYEYVASREENQSFYVNYNTFEDGTITHYDGVWKQARAGEQQYVLRALKEQGKAFKLGSNVTGRVVDYGNDAVTLEVTTKKGEKVLVEVESNNFRQAANLVQSNIDKVVANSENGKFTLKASAENITKQPNAGQSATDAFDVKPQSDESKVLKGIKSDLKRYGEALKPQSSSPGKKPKDIRTTEDFLAGYKQGHAEQVVNGFRPNMNIKQLVDLLVKGNWSPEQKGALAWEIESRALKVTFQPRAEKYNRLFRDVASTGIADTKASEQLAPQLLLLNLSNDGFGGRCDPLSKLVLVAKQLENDGQDGVARQLLEKMYSSAAVLSNPDLYSATERANADKLLGSLAALHAKNPMADTFIKVWKEKLEDTKALTVDGVIQRITAGNTEDKPVLLELDGPDHAMAAWAKGNSEDRVYGFYDPNVGIVEFSSAEKFSAYVTRFFGESDLNMAQSYRLPKNAAGESVFERVAVIDGEVLATYRPRAADKITMRDMLELPVFDDASIKKPIGIDAADGVKKPLSDNSLESHMHVNNQDVNSWEDIAVKPQPEGGDSRFAGQVIIQTENDPVVAEAAANLAGKHPDSSVIVQLDANGQYRVVYGDPAVLSDKLQSGKLRWQIVGHGREELAQNHTRMSGYSADELALKLKQFRTDFKQVGRPDHISLVGCSLIGDDNRNGFAHHFISELDKLGIRTTVSARSSEVAVDSIGRKYTKDAQEQWVHKLTDNKLVLGWNDKGELESHSERVRRGIAENDINLSRVGQTEVAAKAQGAIADNAETFHAPKQRDTADNHSTVVSSNNQLSYSGNIQVQAGDGEFTVINWGTTNVGIKVGTGGFKSMAFGDNNVMVHIGEGNSKHSVDIAGYQALEGAQLFVGNRNISFNIGRSNDLIVMLEKSIPTPPLVNPFDGAARISGVLQNIAGSFNSPDWLATQNQQWTLESAKKYVSDLSGLDLTSSVDYKTLTDLDSQNERSSRGLKNDLESTLNKKYNQWLSGNGNTPEMGKISRADKFRQANEKLAFNFAVGGQGADIQVTAGNWNFMFGDNIQSILDTNLGSLFGLMTQEYTSTGMAKTTFTFSPTDLPRQLKNKLLGDLAGVNADTTLADIFGVDYTPKGDIVSRSGQPVDGVAILRQMLEIIGEFSSDQLQAFTDQEKLLDSLKASLNMGADGVRSFAESHGLKAKAPDESQEGHVSISKGDESTPETADVQADRPVGLTSLNLPNLFATLFNQDKQAEMKSLVTNLKKNLTADLLNIEDKTFDFLRNSGHLQGDGDIHVSLGNYNFNWGGDGKDLGAYLGDNNNVWGGRGDDVFYSVGTSNIFTGGQGNDVGVMMGRENMMFGGAGNDVAVLAGRINYAYMGSGDDQAFVFGEGGMVDGGKGRDYIVASGNFNRIDAGEDQDYVVAIGNNNRVDLGEGNDFATVFGNYNQIDGNVGNNAIKLMGYHAIINGGTGNDHLIADVVSKFSQLNGGDGDDLLILGGYQNRFKGGTGVNSFVVSGDVIDNVVEDIKQGDKIIFNDINGQNLWLQRSGYDLVLLTQRNVKDTSAQGQFEAMGSVTFNDYFNGNRADIITQMGDKDTQGEREYTVLSANAVDSLVQAMSGFAPNMGDSGFIDSLDSKTKSTIMTAWSDTINGKSKLA